MVISIKDLIGIVGIVLSFAFIITNLISNRKIWVIPTILFIVVGGAIALRIFKNDLYIKYLNFIPNPENILLIASGGSLFFSLLGFLISSRLNNNKRKIIKQGSFLNDSRVLAFTTKRHRIFQYSKKINEIIRGLKVKDNEFKIQKVIIGNEIEIQPKHAIKAIGRAGGLVDLPIKFKFKYSNGLETDLEIVKKEIRKTIDNKKVIGYALLDNSISTSYKIEVDKEYRRNLYIYLDLLNQPIAYFDQTTKGYILSNSLLKFLNLTERVITSENLIKIMHPEDITEYENIRIEEGRLKQRFFRLKSGSSYYWFEEATVNYFKNDFIMLKKTDSSYSLDLKFEGYKTMVKAIAEVNQAKTEYGLVILNMESLNAISTSMGSDYTDIIVNKYFTKILNGSLKGQVKLYKIGAVEYAILIDGQEYIDLAIRNLVNNSSELLSQDVYVSRKRNHVNAKVALVLSRDIEDSDPRVIIKTAFDTIKVVTDVGFVSDYYIYQPIKIVERQYSLENLGIDFDENLDEFKDVLDE